MKIFYTDHFVLPTPLGHRFPMSKYALLRCRVAAFLAEFVPTPQLLHEPEAANDDELTLAHTREYVQRVQAGELSEKEVRAIGFPWSLAMVERSRRSSGATIAAARHAIANKSCGVNLAGGTHHAFADRGEGFCVFNDSAITARLMQREFAHIKKVLIVDLDVHQGNGTASILRGDDSIFTFSIHGEKNYPVRKEQSDLDIELPDDCDDHTYLTTLRAHLPELIARVQPQLAIYVAGADPYEGDRLGRLGLSKAGLQARDEYVMTTLRDAGVPMTVSMAGGYAENVDDIVDIHFNTVRTALAVFGVVAP
jgi:acetoin utilization deacetylase AcuC-like enzyme